jgi:hypothetical protein
MWTNAVLTLTWVATLGIANAIPFFLGRFVKNLASRARAPTRRFAQKFILKLV